MDRRAELEGAENTMDRWVGDRWLDRLMILPAHCLNETKNNPGQALRRHCPHSVRVPRMGPGLSLGVKTAGR